jgi:hypothetical protein
MRRILVGKRNGKRVINWPAVLLTALVVGFVSGAAGAATWFVLTKDFDLFAVLLPVCMFMGYWGIAFGT